MWWLHPTPHTDAGSPEVANHEVSRGDDVDHEDDTVYCVTAVMQRRRDDTNDGKCGRVWGEVVVPVG